MRMLVPPESSVRRRSRAGSTVFLSAFTAGSSRGLPKAELPLLRGHK